MEIFFIKTFVTEPHQEGICLFSYFPKVGSYLKNLQMASFYIKLKHKSMSTQYIIIIYCVIKKSHHLCNISIIACLIWYFFDIYITNKFQTNMVSIQEMLIGDVQEETEEKIDIEHGFPHLTAISSSDEDNMPK
jgi:hypothetical protein